MHSTYFRLQMCIQLKVLCGQSLHAWALAYSGGLVGMMSTFDVM